MASMTDAVMGDLLRRVPMFAEVPAPALEQLVKASRPLPRRKGARVFEEGSASDCCLVLTSGRAKVILRGARDSEITLGVVEPFTLVGEIGLLDGSDRSAGLVALEDCQFIRIPAAAFNLLRANGVFADRLIRHLAITIRKANDQLRAICTFKAEDRVMWCLARLAKQRGVQHGGSLVIRPKPAHQELADMTGCSRETVSRALMNLKRRNHVGWDSESLRLDVAALQRRGAGTWPFADATEVTRLV